MKRAVDRFRSADPGWRAALVGVAAAPGLVPFALAIGIVEGVLLPGACQGLACLFGLVVLRASAVIVGILAAISWVPVAWLGVFVLE